MPSNGFPFAIRVSGQVDVIGLLDGLGDGIHMLFIAFHQLVLHGEMIGGIHSAGLGDQVAHMAIRSQDFESRAKVFFKSFRLRGRLYDEQAFGHGIKLLKDPILVVNEFFNQQRLKGIALAPQYHQYDQLEAVQIDFGFIQGHDA